MIKQLVPMLYTIQLEETVEFYTEILGFECTAHRPDWGWASLKMGKVELMLSLPNEHLPFQAPAFTGSFYFYTDQVDRLWEKWNDQVEVAYPIEDFEHGMREFAIYDINGYLLQFGQELDD